jgi:hypothetical protein
LKSNPDKTYLFITVIIIEDPQYASTGKDAWLDSDDGPDELGRRDGGV